MSSALRWIDSTFGFRGRGLLAWGVAAGCTYLTVVIPEWQEKQRREKIAEEWMEKHRQEPAKYPYDGKSMRTPWLPPRKEDK
jgi:hypothetical protein